MVNSRCPNYDFPQWGDSTNRLYTKEILSDSKQFKKKLTILQKKDVFGNQPVSVSKVKFYNLK